MAFGILSHPLFWFFSLFLFVMSEYILYFCAKKKKYG